MRHDTKPRLFTRPYWRYVREQTHLTVRRKAASKRLDARIQDLPDELQLNILEHWTQANPITVSDLGTVRHPLVYKTAKLLRANENAAVYRAAPIVINLCPRPLVDGGCADTASWLRALEFATQLRETDGQKVTKRHFLDFHDKHHGEAARKHIRVHVKVLLGSNCPKRPRIYCAGSREVTQEPLGCPHLTCRPQNQYVLDHAQAFSSQIAEHTGVPRENITTEFYFSHSCWVSEPLEPLCEFLHGPCALKIATFTAVCLPPLVLTVAPAWYCASVVKMAVDPWNEYTRRFERHEDVTLPEKLILYAVDLGLVSLGAVAIGPLVFPLGWTIRRFVAMVKAASTAHQARRGRKGLCKAAERQFKAAAAEKAAAVDRLRKLDPLSAFQLADLDCEDSWSETILIRMTGVWHLTCPDLSVANM